MSLQEANPDAQDSQQIPRRIVVKGVNGFPETFLYEEIYIRIYGKPLTTIHTPHLEADIAFPAVERSGMMIH
jgi:hypothetical protein